MKILRRPALGTCNRWVLLAAMLSGVLNWGVAAGQVFDGVWRSQGYGAVFELNDGEAALYDETAISFLPVATATVAGNVARLDDDPGADPFFLERDGEQLVVVNEATTIRFDRLDQLPAIRGTAATAQNVFDVFWQTIEEQFPSFTLLGLDWSAQRAAWRPQVRAGMPANALQDLLSSMAQPLLDGHTTLLNPASGRFINTGPRPSRLADALAQEVMDNVESRYIDGGLFNRLAADSRLLWGTLRDGRVGYLAIRDYENRPVPFADSLDQALASLQETQALVIDLRHNDGGNNRHALALGSRLTEKQRVAYSQQARNGGPEDFTDPVPLQIAPQGAGYRDRPVYLVTNDGTASAGDVQSLILSSIPYVTQVGETTRGMFSHIRRGLPNGWVLTTSNERFLSPDGLNYELAGIEPEIFVENTEAALQRGDDLILDAVLSDLDKRLPIESGSLPVGPAMSGSWYAPDHDGEGFLLEILDDGRAVVYWFTYAPADGVQEWLVAIGEVSGDRIEFGVVLAPRGARFGEAFDPDDVVRAPWGEMTLRFTSCDRAIATYDGPDGHGANFKSLQRLTGHAGIDCSGVAAMPNRFSGSWYDSSRSGEGWILGQVTEDLVLAVWFTYDPEGNPLWLIGTGSAQGEAVLIEDLLEPVGGRFGPAFNPEDVERRPWGRATFRAIGCDAMGVEWQANSAEFGSGEGTLERLTQLAGLACAGS
jgi:hypothetical protein